MHYRLIVERWDGRLCNNITQLCNAIYVAQQTRSRLELPPHKGWLEVSDLDFSDGNPCSRTIRSKFFDLHNEPIGNCPTPDWNTKRRILKTWVRPMLPAGLFPRTGVEELAIHIRSGDIFNRAAKDTQDAGDFGFTALAGPLLCLWRRWKNGHRVHPDFVQPPLSFYRRIIQSRQWSSIRLVAEDQENPVIPELLRSYSDIQFQAADLESDVRRLLTASHVVIGYGTFGIIWALLSDHLESLYTPLVPALALGALRPGDLAETEVHAFEFNNYIPFGQWQATQEQRQLMVTHAAGDVVEIGPACPVGAPA